MRIVNLTQHPATADQREAGCWNLSGEQLAGLKLALTFDALPTAEEIATRADQVADLALAAGASPGESAMIGGAPFLMAQLEAALKDAGLRPVYAFSRREVVETETENGSVAKTAVFRHLGFVEAL